MDVGRRNQQPNPAATHDMTEVGHDLRHRHAAISAALVAPIEREPAQPPTGIIAAIGVQDIEPDQGVVGFDAGHDMCRATADGGLDLLDRPQKVLNLLRFEHEVRDDTDVGVADPVVAEGRRAPGGKHGAYGFEADGNSRNRGLTDLCRSIPLSGARVGANHAESLGHALEYDPSTPINKVSATRSSRMTRGIRRWPNGNQSLNHVPLALAANRPISAASALTRG